MSTTMTGRIRGVLVHTDGRAEVLTVPADWRELNAVIGASWGQAVRTCLPGVLLWVDEEGRLNGRPVNRSLSHRLYLGVIAGTVLIVGETGEPESDVASLTDQQIAELEAWLIITEPATDAGHIRLIGQG